MTPTTTMPPLTRDARRVLACLAVGDPVRYGLPADVLGAELSRTRHDTARARTVAATRAILLIQARCPGLVVVGHGLGLALTGRRRRVYSLTSPVF